MRLSASFSQPTAVQLKTERHTSYTLLQQELTAKYDDDRTDDNLFTVR